MISCAQTARAPLLKGHYSQACVANGLVFVAAQLPLVPGAESQIPAAIGDQTRQSLANVAAILMGAGSDLAQLVSVTIFVTDMAHWPAVDGAHADVLRGHRPARGVFVSPQLHLNAGVAVQAIGVVPHRAAPR